MQLRKQSLLNCWLTHKWMAAEETRPAQLLVDTQMNGSRGNKASSTIGWHTKEWQQRKQSLLNYWLTHKRMAAEETKPAQLLVDTQMNGSRGNKASSTIGWHTNEWQQRKQSQLNYWLTHKWMAAEETKPAQLLVDTQMNGSRGNKASSTIGWHTNEWQQRKQSQLNYWLTHKWMAAEETKPAQLLVDTQMNGSRGNKATSHQNTSKLKIQAMINKNTEGLCTFSCEDVTDKKKKASTLMLKYAVYTVAKFWSLLSKSIALCMFKA